MRIKTTCGLVTLIIALSMHAAALHAQKEAEKKTGVASGTVKPAKPIKPQDDEQKKKDRDRKKAEWIEKTLKYGINKDRREALNNILDIRDDAVKKDMERLLVDVLKEETDADVKIKAITVASELKLSAAGPYFIKSLEDESVDVRIAAVQGLKRINDSSSAPTLVTKLKAQDLSTESNYTEALIDALGAFKAAELAGFAEAAVKDLKTTRNIRQQMVLFLGKIGSVGQKDFLVKLLTDEEEDADIRSYAANSLSHLGLKETAADLDKVITTIEGYPFKKKKDYYTLYLYCVAAMAKLGDDRAFPRLMNALKSDSAASRIKAINLLGELKDKRSIDILKYKRDHDPNSGVQKAAREALKEMGVSDKKEK